MAAATAPVATSRAITVAATPEVVWATLAAVERWPAWNSDILWVRPDGPLAIGMTFRWKSGPGTIRSTVRELDPPRHLVLVGGTMGIAARHDWRIEPAPGGAALVRTEEAWSGALARLLRGRLQARLERRIDERLAHLRAEVERVAAGGGEAGATTAGGGGTVAGGGDTVAGGGGTGAGGEGPGPRA